MSALAGAGISLVCLLVWTGALIAGRRGGPRGFLAAHLGGMALRLVLALGLSAWALAGLRVRPAVFAASLLGSYALLLVLEVLWIARQRRRASAAPAGANEIASRPCA